MTFETVVFGSYEIGAGFTAGDSITEGGYRVFIVPTVNMGDNAMDVSISYTDQFGNPATTAVSTSVPAHTVSGTHVQMVLNNGDSGVRQVTGVNVVGGTAGETFNLESWNEGLGGALELGERGQLDGREQASWTVKDYAMNHLLENESVNTLVFLENISTSNVSYDGSSFTLLTEQIDVYPEADIDDDDGFLSCAVTLDNYTMKMRMDLYPETEYTYIDTNYSNHAFICQKSGFTKITFDYSVVLDASYFVLELLDSTGTVKWSKNGTASGTGQVVTFVDTEFTFRVRCKITNTTPAAPWANFAEISNVVLDRYKTSGYIEQIAYKYRENMKELSLLYLSGTLGTAGTNVRAHMDVGDSLGSTTGFVGPGGTSGSYYSIGGNVIYTGAYRGSYWRTKVYLVSDGRYTPQFDHLKYTYFTYNYFRPLEFPVTKPKTIDATIQHLPLELWRNAEVTLNAALPLSGANYVTPANLLLQITQAHQRTVDNESDLIRVYGRWYFQLYDATDFVYGCNYSNVEFMSNTFRLKAETVEPDYSADIDSYSGFLPCSAIINAGSKEFSITLPAETFFDCIDTEYQRHSFIWDVSGFTSVTFDYDVFLNSTYFVLELVDFDFNNEKNDIDYIRYLSLKNAGKITVTIEVLKNTSSFSSSTAPGTVYRNINIWVGKTGYATEENIKDPTIGFRVDRAWALDNDIEAGSIGLYRHSGGAWEQLPTEPSGSDGNYLYFEARTPGFSPFAITGQSTASQTENVVEGNILLEEETETNKVPLPGESSGSDNDSSTSNTRSLVYAGITGMMLTIAYLLVRK